MYTESKRHPGGTGGSTAVTIRWYSVTQPVTRLVIPRGAFGTFGAQKYKKRMGYAGIKTREMAIQAQRHPKNSADLKAALPAAGRVSRFAMQKKGKQKQNRESGWRLA